MIWADYLEKETHMKLNELKIDNARITSVGGEAH